MGDSANEYIERREQHFREEISRLTKENEDASRRCYENVMDVEIVDKSRKMIAIGTFLGSMEGSLEIDLPTLLELFQV